MRKNPWQFVRDFYHSKRKRQKQTYCLYYTFGQVQETKDVPVSLSGEGSNLESREQQKTERKEKLDPVAVKESCQASL